MERCRMIRPAGRLARHAARLGAFALLLALAGCVEEAAKSMVAAKEESNAKAAVAQLRSIASAELVYAAKIQNGGAYGSLADMAAQKVLDGRFRDGTATLSGYTYTCEVSPVGFKVKAAARNPGEPSFFIDQSNAVFYSDGSPVEQ